TPSVCCSPRELPWESIPSPDGGGTSAARRIYALWSAKSTRSSIPGLQFVLSKKCNRPPISEPPGTFQNQPMDFAHPVRAPALLVMVFCAFFGLGFFAGKNSIGPVTAAPLDTPQSERLHFQIARD